ncbi:MAG: RNA-binding protein [Chloroflexi bacterium]|nr:RNA-binding protein [Chloroflexota bacterium]
MNKKLYIGSLSYDTTDDGLRELFSAAGAVLSAEVIRDRYTGRSKGFGFVEMETVAEAEKAIGEFNGAMLDGREIKVAEAQPRRESSQGFDRRGGGGDRRDRPQDSDRRGGGGDRRDRPQDSDRRGGDRRERW